MKRTQTLPKSDEDDWEDTPVLYNLTIYEYDDIQEPTGVLDPDGHMIFRVSAPRSPIGFLADVPDLDTDETYFYATGPKEDD